MKTDVLRVSESKEELEGILDKIEYIALYTGMSRKDSSSMRLLAEELLTAMKGILDAYDGLLWMETSESKFTLHLSVEKPVNRAERKKVIALAKSGDLSPSPKLFSRLGTALEKFFVLDDDEISSAMLTHYGLYTNAVDGMGEQLMYTYSYLPGHAKPEEKEQPQDELQGVEKSIIDAIVDDIFVTVQKGNMEIVAIKDL